MPRKIDTVEKNGIQYQIEELGGKTAGLVMYRLARAGMSVVTAMQDGSFSPAALPQSEFEWLRDTLIPTTKIGIVDEAGGGTVRFMPLAIVFDDTFAGVRAPEQFTWIRAALEVTFGPLDVVVRGIFTGLKGASLSSSLTAAIGSAGDSSSPRG